MHISLALLFQLCALRHFRLLVGRIRHLVPMCSTYTSFHRLAFQCHRVLKSGGTFIVITYGNPQYIHALRKSNVLATLAPTEEHPQQQARLGFSRHVYTCNRVFIGIYSHPRPAHVHHEGHTIAVVYGYTLQTKRWAAYNLFCICRSRLNYLSKSRYSWTTDHVSVGGSRFMYIMQKQ